MAKEKTGVAEKTPDLFPKKRGRPASVDAMTGAQRLAKLRATRKAAGLCQCCGQALPEKPTNSVGSVGSGVNHLAAPAAGNVIKRL